MRFNGPDYNHARDSERLSTQHMRIHWLMRDGEWRTLEQISTATGDPPASVSAQLRHMRKPRFGGHDVERRHISGGLFEYRLTLKDDGND